MSKRRIRRTVAEWSPWVVGAAVPAATLGAVLVADGPGAVFGVFVAAQTLAIAALWAWSRARREFDLTEYSERAREALVSRGAAVEAALEAGRALGADAELLGELRQALTDGRAVWAEKDAWVNRLLAKKPHPVEVYDNAYRFEDAAYVVARWDWERALGDRENVRTELISRAAALDGAAAERFRAAVDAQRWDGLRCEWVLVRVRLPAVAADPWWAAALARVDA